MSAFENPYFDDHESVHQFVDRASGLRAIIAIHSTMLGSAAGGCRYMHYPNSSDGLADALRLSRAMTYKNAMAGLPFGGGKGIVLGERATPKSAELLEAFGRAVQSLGGRYITGQDIGVAQRDLQYIARKTSYVAGVAGSSGTSNDNTSPWTALGVLLGIQAAVEYELKYNGLRDIRVAVQGVGKVGSELCRLLHSAGAKIFVSDTNKIALDSLCDELPVVPVPFGDIMRCEADVFSPCALGQILNAGNIPKLLARIVAGAANNQLATPADGDSLADRGILYAPDYIINAGGVISVCRRYQGRCTDDEIREHIARIPMRLHAVFSDATGSGRATGVVADEQARRILENARHGCAVDP